MNTIFRRDSTLFLLKDGVEYQVENPEVVGENVDIGHGNDFILRYPLKTKCGSPFIHSTERVEWPYGVEVIEADECGHPCDDYGDVCQYSGCGYKGRKLARLLPKEQDKGAMSYSEGEPRNLNSQYNCPIDNKPCYMSNCIHSDEYPALCGNKLEKMQAAESLEPQERETEPCPNCKETVEICACFRNKCNRCGNPVGNITFTICDDCWDKEFPKKAPVAPVESQEEMWKALIDMYDLTDASSYGYATLIKKLSQHFSITRLTP